jgi:hypothetical protein
MGTDGHQKHSKAVENTGRNSFSTLASTLIDLCFLVTDLCLRTPRRCGMARVRTRVLEHPWHNFSLCFQGDAASTSAFLLKRSQNHFEIESIETFI